ncbi:MAG: isoprenylcysteine carboxylmethyltransferase family protein [Methanotrichaceae archaeon]|nr:isoprenylcysteine carboxylmethyltransferase family protein [Methanotrichaceae archaeon]
MGEHLLARLLASGTVSLLAALAGGGLSFIGRPLGAAYVIMLFLWMATVSATRSTGEESSYDRRQRPFYAMLSVIFLLLFFLPPWEYAHLEGPIPRDGLLAWAGLGLMAVGTSLRTAATIELRGFYTARLSVRAGQSVVTTGPYRNIRHPGYLGELLTILGISLAMGCLSGLLLLLATLILLIKRMDAEEEMMISELGREYLDYMGGTSRLVPRLY